MIHLQRALVAVAFGIALFMLAPPTSPLMTSMRSRVPAPGAGTGAVEAAAVDVVPQATPGQTRPRPTPPKVKGIIMSGYTVGGSRFQSLVDLVERTELNAVVIDIKDEAGEISWVPTSPVLRHAGAGIPKIRDPRATIAGLKAKNIWVIGRIVTFHDPVLAKARPDLAVQDIDGGLWTDRKGRPWTDPFSPEVWDYNLTLAREAVDLGFDEIQFDYVRFPADGATHQTWYLHRDGRPEAEVIRAFLAEARRQLVPMGAWLSADLFGLVTLATHDLGIGQRIELIAEEVDYLSLMLYPSHYNKPEYGIADPEKEPYKTIFVSLRDAQRRTKGMRAQLRPWFQDFSLRVKYTPKEVRAQIEAAEDLGVEEWLLWNARNRYSEDALRPDRTGR